MLTSNLLYPAKNLVSSTLVQPVLARHDLVAVSLNERILRGQRSRASVAGVREPSLVCVALKREKRLFPGLMQENQRGCVEGSSKQGRRPQAPRLLYLSLDQNLHRWGRARAS